MTAFVEMLRKMLLLPLALLFIAFSDGDGAITPTKYMTYYCKKGLPTLFLNDSLVLELSKHLSSGRTNSKYVHCALNVKTYQGRHVLLQFSRLNIADFYGTPDRLQIFDIGSNNYANRLTPPDGAYGVYPGKQRFRGVADYNSTWNELRLDYFGKPTKTEMGFNLLLTPFIKTSTNKCPAGYMHCSIKKICISSSLMCDGYHNCGSFDESDESKCGYYSFAQNSSNWGQGTTFTAIIAGVIAILVFLILALVITVITCKYNRKHGLSLAPVHKGNELTSNNVSCSYDPPSYEDVVGTTTDEEVNEPPLYNITTAEDNSNLRTEKKQNFTRNHDADSLTMKRLARRQELLSNTITVLDESVSAKANEKESSLFSNCTNFHKQPRGISTEEKVSNI